jgi:hypothetical protein
MKQNETTPGGSVGECVVPERSTNKDRPMKRRGIESRVLSGDTSSSGSKGQEDKL